MEDEVCIELERLSVLKRMCRLSCVILLVAVASVMVGIMAITYSAGKFPFNAGGAIIAGLVAAILSFCPMCLLVQARKYQKTRKSSYNCCCIAMLVWSTIAILGMIFGLATNGIGAVIACNNRSKDTGCWLNKESQFALAVVTIVLTTILILLVITLFVICCCNCSLVGDVTDMDYYIARLNHGRNIYSIPTRDVTPRHTTVDNHSAGSGERDNGHYATPTAPPAFAQYTSDIYIARLSAGMESYNTSYIARDNDSERFGDTHAFDSPPPSYNEVMANDSMETPL